ncbi:hypothetical protein AB0K35_27680 [Micromonospora sp. NPDC053740]|uniref:hypothetical protein n=1 Tax=Micromonospora sp. NPDC053740 TaxID=3155173 RepID=UPI003432C543
MNEFLGWLSLLVLLLIAALLGFGVVAYVTGGEVTDWEMRWLARGMVALLLMVGLGYILDPNAEPMKRRRR